MAAFAPQGAAQAQAADTAANADFASQTTRRYDVAPGPLATVLNQYVQAAGVLISFDASALEGLRSPGVQGSYSVAEGFRQVLRGSGFEAVATGPGRYGLRAEPAGQARMLEEVTVRGRMNATTEGQNSYTSASMNTATPLSLSIRETPQSVSVVTRDRMDDGALATVDNALSYTTGMTVVSSGVDRSSYSARGFSVNNIMIDGVALDHDIDAFSASGMEMFDRIEVVRGATGLMEGAGNPSASVNLVLKKPTDVFQAEASVSAGSWNNYQGIVDVSGPVSESKTLRGRAVASMQHSDSFTLASERKRRLFYGVLSADLTERTTVTLGTYYTKDQNPGTDHSGIPTREDGSFYDVDRSFRASPAWAYSSKQNVNVFGEVAHEFLNGWKAELKGSFWRGKRYIYNAQTWGRDANDTFAYSTRNYDQTQKTHAMDVRASGPLSLLGRKHELAVGANYRRTTYHSWGGPTYNTYAYRFDPLHWKEAIDFPEPSDWNLDDYFWDMKQVQYGAFLTAKANIADPLNVFLGGRLSWFRYDDSMKSGTWSQISSYKASREFTPYAAVTLDLGELHTVYGSLTSIFKPQNYVMSNGGLIDPVESINYEMGIKGEYLGGRLNASLALFRIDQTNLPSQLPVSACPGLPTSCYEATGKVRSQGVEAELSGNLTDNWRIFLGYTYVSAKHIEDSSAGRAGDRYATTTPRHVLTLSTVYAFSGRMAGWRAGVSARLQSEIENTRSGYATVRQPGYGVVNLMLGYRPTSNLDIQLNLNNLFDRYYYQSVGSPIHGNLFGEPRNVLLTMKYQF